MDQQQRKMEIIIIEFEDDGGVAWASAGWGDDPEKMAAAKKAINDGECREDVIDNLCKAGFEVMEMGNDGIM